MKKGLLISPNTETCPTIFPIGLGYIRAGLLKNGFEVGILDFAHLPLQEEVLLSYLCEHNPEYIGISIRNLDNCCYMHPRSFIEPVKELVGWIKAWNPTVPVILGGSGFSLLPEVWLRITKADYGIHGDGIESFPRLLNCIQNKKEPDNVPGVIYAKNSSWIRCDAEQIERLNKLPFPSRDGFLHFLKDNQNVRHNIQTKRGCSFKCSYCAYPILEGKKLRLRSPSNVVDEICELLERYHINEFDFVDNVFNNPSEHAVEICHELISRKVKVSWGCFLNPISCTENFLRILMKAGCKHVEFGIDSGSSKILRNMRKNFDIDDICMAVNNCKTVNISYSCCLLFGSPGEDMDTVRETLQLMESLDVEQVFGLIGVRILPNTEIHQKYAKNLSEAQLLEPEFYISKGIQPKQVWDEFNIFYSQRHPGWMII